jgi:hypothetical protein
VTAPFGGEARRTWPPAAASGTLRRHDLCGRHRAATSQPR